MVSTGTRTRARKNKRSSQLDHMVEWHWQSILHNKKKDDMLYLLRHLRYSGAQVAKNVMSDPYFAEIVADFVIRKLAAFTSNKSAIAITTLGIEVVRRFDKT